MNVSDGGKKYIDGIIMDLVKFKTNFARNPTNLQFVG